MFSASSLAVALVVFSTAGQVSGQAQQQAEPPGEEVVVKGTKPASAKRVCKRSGQTGSIMAKTTCKTVAEWEQLAASSIAMRDRIEQERRARMHTDLTHKSGN